MSTYSPFYRLCFLGASSSLEGASAVVVGLPYDGTSSYRAGSRFAPNAIRQSSVGNIEMYEPLLDLDIDDVLFADVGDLDIEFGYGAERFVDEARRALATLPTNVPALGLGGEHSVTLPLVEHALKSHPDLGFLVFDAHTDLRDEYSGSRFSHACVTKRVVDLVGPERVAMIGIRSGLREEFILARDSGLLFDATDEGFSAALDKLGDRPIYLSIDLDGFDPRELPGTGTPEPGGLTWEQVSRWLVKLREQRLVGADVVELLPDADPTGRSTALAARLVRLLLLLLR